MAAQFWAFYPHEVIQSGLIAYLAWRNYKVSKALATLYREVDRR